MTEEDGKSKVSVILFNNCSQILSYAVAYKTRSYNTLATNTLGKYSKVY